jgi:hypothetical protein
MININKKVNKKKSQFAEINPLNKKLYQLRQIIRMESTFIDNMLKIYFCAIFKAYKQTHSKNRPLCCKSY